MKAGLENEMRMTHLWAPYRCSRSMTLADVSFGFGEDLVWAAATGAISLETVRWWR